MNHFGKGGFIWYCLLILRPKDTVIDRRFMISFATHRPTRYHYHKGCREFSCIMARRLYERAVYKGTIPIILSKNSWKEQ